MTRKSLKNPAIASGVYELTPSQSFNKKLKRRDPAFSPQCSVLPWAPLVLKTLTCFADAPAEPGEPPHEEGSMA